MDKWNKAGVVIAAGQLFFGARSFILAAVLVVWTVWPSQGQSRMIRWLLPSALIFSLLMAGLLHLAAALIARGKKNIPPPPVDNKPSGVDQKTHKQVVDKLNERESEVRHWKEEVRREKLQAEGQISIREEQLTKSRSELANLEQQLRVTQAKADKYSIPRGRLRIKKAEYSIPGKVGLDVTETLERMILDERLMLGDVPYNDLFHHDPWPGDPKQLQIDFSHGLENFSVTVPENTKITLPFPYDKFKF